MYRGNKSQMQYKCKKNMYPSRGFLMAEDAKMVCIDGKGGASQF